MNNDQCQTVTALLSRIDGVQVREKRGSSLTFLMYMTRTMKETSIEALDLGARAYHSLKRAGYDTIGELAADISAGMELGKLRNCGKNSVREIMERLFLYQYYSLQPENRKDYLAEVIMINLSKDSESSVG